MSHILYADDLMAFGRANDKEVKSFQDCFNKYCSWLGQAPNLEKSQVLFSKNTAANIRIAIKTIMGFKELKKEFCVSGQPASAQ